MYKPHVKLHLICYLVYNRCVKAVNVVSNEGTTDSFLIYSLLLLNVALVEQSVNSSHKLYLLVPVDYTLY